MTELGDPVLDHGPVTASWRDYVAPLRRHDFRWLVGGQMLSTLGDMLLVVVLPFIVLAVGDAGDLTLVLAALGIARAIGAPIGGVLADRWDPRLVMLCTDVARAAVVLGLVAVAANLEQDGLVLFGVGVAVLGALDGLFLPAYWATVPTLLPKDQLAVGNAVGESLLVFTVMAGTLVGGLVAAATAPSTVLLVNAATFVLSALTLLRMRGRLARSAPAAAAEAGGFLAFARGSALFVSIMVMAGMLNLTSAGVMNVALPVFVDDTSASGEEMFGFLLSTHGAGLLAGTVAAGLAWRMRRRGLLAVGLMVVDGFALLAFPHLPGIAAQLVATFVLGLVAGVLSVLAVTILQQTAPDALRGRVMAALSAVTLGAYPISATLVGLIVVGSGTTAAFLFSAFGVFAAAAIGAARRAVRDA